MRTIRVYGSYLTELSKGIYAFHTEEIGEQVIITVDAAHDLILKTHQYGFEPR